MSLLLDIVNTVRSLRLETEPPVPYTSPYTNTGGNLFSSSSSEPTERQLNLTTVESTLFTVLDLISGDVGSTEWHLYLKDSGKIRRADEQRIELTSEDHIVAKLWNTPNDFMSGVHLRTVVEWHYDSVGEGWIVCEYNDLGMPESFWPVRPDRMEPVTDPDKFLLGYKYKAPSGGKIPLELNEVLRITRPHPIDPHRGIGPVFSLSKALGTSLTQQQWLSKFFDNDATPGGVIELNQDEPMDGGDYRKIVSRWNDQHKGVNRAHRVGILEMGSYKPFAINLRQLQFTEMRHLTRDQILEAFRIHKHMIGASDDVNRAAAVAADATYGKRTLDPRLKVWKSLANGDYLRTFGPLPRPVEWFYDSPIPADEEIENAERTNKSTAAATLVTAGWHEDDVLETVGLPPMRFKGRGNGTSTSA